MLGVETLAVKNMIAHGGRRKRGLNRALHDAGLGTLLRHMDYKSGWYGARLAKADRHYPSSKTCSGCGTVKTKLSLAERRYACERCGLVLDRDLNAAINLARHALRETTGVITPGGSGPLDTGGADRKTTFRAWQVATETGTRTGDGQPAAGGTAPPQGEAA